MTLAEAVQYWRGFSGEWDSTVVPSSGSTTKENVQDYLQRAAEWLNDLVGYSWKDSTITLTAGAEATLPTDFIDVVFVTIDGVLLKQTDIEDLNQKSPDWRTRANDRPEEYYLYSKIGFYPAPDAAAVAATTVMRHLGTPTLSTTPGFDLLATQHHRIPVYYAVGLWFEAHGLDGDGFRAARFMARAEKEAERVKEYYAKRRLQRGLGG